MVDSGACVSPAGLALARAAESMLRALGGYGVAVLFPKATAPDDPGAQLGLVAAGVEEVLVGPAALKSLSSEKRDGRVRVEFIFSASTLSAVAEAQQAESIRAFFQSALGIAHEGRLLRIQSVESDAIGNVPYLYRVTAGE